MTGDVSSVPPILFSNNEKPFRKYHQITCIYETLYWFSPYNKQRSLQFKNGKDYSKKLTLNICGIGSLCEYRSIVIDVGDYNPDVTGITETKAVSDLYSQAHVLHPGVRWRIDVNPTPYFKTVRSSGYVEQ